MIREIEIIDFMSHRHTVIEPAAGLTVLVGPNNCGKSAVVAALQILAANSRKDHMIRHGCRECAVTVETDDGHTITWRRKGKIVNYTIDGQDVHRLEGDVPEGLHDVLKLAPVESVEGDERFDVHFAQQKEPIFLLNGTGKQAATFFASSSDASRLVAMQQRHRDKMREQGQAERFVAGQVDELKLQLTALTAVPDLQLAIDNGVREYDRLQNQATYIDEFERRIRLLVSQGAVVEQANARCDAMVLLAPPPMLSDTQTLETLVKKLTTIGAEITSHGAHRAVLVHLFAPPELAEVAGLQRLCRDLAEERSTECHESARAHELRSLAVPPLLAETADIERLCQNISQESLALTASTSMAGALRNLPAPPELQDTIALKSMIEASAISINGVAERIAEVDVLTNVEAPPSLITDTVLMRSITEFEAAQNLLRSHQEDMGLIDRAIKDVRGQIAQWTEANPTCPTCGGPIDADRLLLGAEAHDHG